MKRILVLLLLVSCVDSFAREPKEDWPPQDTRARVTAPQTTVYVPLRADLEQYAVTVETPAPTPTTTPLGFEPRCPNLLPYIQQAGFPREDWAHVDYLGWRESRCARTGDGSPRCAHNPTDPAGGSYGPLQINASWAKPNRWNQHPAGYLGKLGIVQSVEELCEWDKNLLASYAIFQYNINTHGYDDRWYAWRL